MIKTKQIAAWCCVLALCASILTACSSGGQPGEAGGSASGSLPPASAQPSNVQSQEAKAMVNVGALSGPAGIGMVGLMEQNEQNKSANIYEFTIAGAPDELSGKLISGELDIAAVPTNMAAMLYARTEGKVQIVSTTTLGVLYLLDRPLEDDAAEDGEDGTAEITSIADLAGQTIYTTGQNATQEYVLKYLLQKNGVTDTAIEFNAEHAELAARMLEGRVRLALLPQPFVTTVTMKDDTVNVALDITREWEDATGTKLAMGAIVVRKEFLEKNSAALDKFLAEYAASVDTVNENVEEAAALCGKFEVIAEDVAKNAIPSCNIICLTGSKMKESVSAYLEILFEAEPKSVGGALPDDAFYYIP